MDNNEFNRRIRYALRLDDADAVRLIELGGQWVSPEHVAGFRCKEEEPEYVACPDEALLALLDGLILDRRGPPPERNTTTGGPAAAEKAPAAGDKAAAKVTDKADKEPAVSNNLVLKQLRIALALRSDDIYTLMVAGGGKVGKTEVGAFFRSPDARNYRRCGDQAVRWFLNGLVAQRGQ
ncbi:DUF1456 family protein [Granulosicoccus antarcticus]|uniref:DUF1456 family protein n=1 Tax=Granulosicoccus antarcticus IMCC3135 TaxID=1192854 RepID=A0A2Z2P0J7_9GAMM|nr:DUF1456 family protein [Granulosicoccus antarcticus]ASJ74680.1 hypothetical protein IMCC3135_23055 [Granulosicoccus antarcticus IMCC3135]